MRTTGLGLGGRLRNAVVPAFWLGVREVRTVWRMPVSFIPGLLVPIFFFFVQVGSLSEFASRSGLANYEAFQLPVSIMFAAASGGAGLNMVTDIESGYFDKLLLTPTSRLALLIGAMGADLVRIFFQCLFVAGVALMTGTEFATGWTGAIAMTFMATLWGIAYSAIGFAIALKTGSSEATQSAFIIFLPMLFLSTAFAPHEALSGWLATAADYNPMTYLLRGMRSLSMSGWEPGEIGLGLLAVAGVGVVTIGAAFRALQSRVR